MKTTLKRIFFVVVALIALAAAVVAIEYFGGQPMGLFAGSRPANLGFNAGKFASPGSKLNVVSSTVEKGDNQHFIAPLTYSGTGAEAWQKLVGIVRASPRALVVTENSSYAHAEFKSAGMGFIDDVEFALDEKSGTIQVRSASRLGVRDFDVNRKRVEAIRAQFGS